MTTTQTDAIMVLADRYAFHIPGSQHSDEARAVLLAALQEQAREGEAVAWHHGCNVLCADIDLWIDRCPHCGKPRPAAPAPQPAQPSDMGIPITQPEQGERPASKAELLKNLTQWFDGLGGAIHTYSLRGIALHGFEKGWDAALQSAQPVAQPLTREQVIAACYSFRHDFGLLPQDVKDSLIRSATDWAKAFGIGGAL